MNISFSHLITSFFTKYLASERGLSENTVASYSDCMKLLVNYACERCGVGPEALQMNMFTRELILAFLDYTETDRRNCEVTRNQRLAAIKSFFSFLARNIPELMEVNSRIQAIRAKKTDHRPPPSLTRDQVEAIIAAPDPLTLLGARDRALLQLLYNTGARVQEIADATISDIRFDTPAEITLTGKGRKRRVVPLWSETAEAVRYYLQLREQAGIHSEHLFLNNKSEPITRFGIARRTKLHADAAAADCPSLRTRSITPHVFRHTAALHLIEAGNDVFLVRDWLGHADIATTSRYVEISIERKRAALEKVPPPINAAVPEPPQWKSPGILDFLTRLSRKQHYVAQNPKPKAHASTRTAAFAT
jgi:site-specific recombinase XerD